MASSCIERPWLSAVFISIDTAYFVVPERQKTALSTYQGVTSSSPERAGSPMMGAVHAMLCVSGKMGEKANVTQLA